MNPILRASHQGTSRFAIAAKTALASQAQHRSTSWIAWEQPNPALYIRPTPTNPAASSNVTQQQAQHQPQSPTKSQDTRSVGKAFTAPSTAAVTPGSSQEIAVSGKTAPLSIRAGTTYIPSGQTRSLQTDSKAQADGEGWHNTTHLCIPGMESTWPGEKPEHPDQKRVRKCRLCTKDCKNKIDESSHNDNSTKGGDGGSSNSSGSEKHSIINEGSDDGSKKYSNFINSFDDRTQSLSRVISSTLLGLYALKQFPVSSYPNVSFRQGIRGFMVELGKKDQERMKEQKQKQEQ